MLRIIRASCGSGKTFSVEEKVIERAKENKRSAILFPTHVIALGTVVTLRRAGVAVRYRMSPHVMIDPTTNEAYCEYGDAAELVSKASLGVRRELCEGLGSSHDVCPKRKTCPAADGVDEDPHPLVFIAPHQLMHEAMEWLGWAGLLVLDEPPPVVETTRIDSEGIEAARYACSYLYNGDVLEVLLSAVEKGIETGETGDAHVVVRAGVEKLDLKNMPRIEFMGFGGDWKKIIERSIESTRSEGRPQLSSYGLNQMRTKSKEIKKTFVKGAQVIAALARALAPFKQGKMVKPAKSGVVGKELVIVEESEHMIRAVNRIGPTVILDATINLAILEKFSMLPFDEKTVIDVEAEDGAPIERVWLQCASASRKGWIEHDRPKLQNFVGPFRRAMQFVSADPARQKLGIVTFKVLAQVIESVWKNIDRPIQPAAGGVWDLLEPWRARGGELVVFHFGGVRGRNEMADVDALVTLGDPWMHKLETAATCAVLELDFQETYRQSCAAELAQAVGRLRAPRRAKEAIVVVVGSVAPDDWTDAAQGGNARIERLEAGRPPAAPPGVRGDVLAAWRAALGMRRRELARLLGVGETTLRRLEGESSPPTAPKLLSLDPSYSVGVSAQHGGHEPPPPAPKLLRPEADTAAPKLLRPLEGVNARTT